MQLTTNYKLKKPEGSDVVNVQDFNDNADILDNALATHTHTKSQITDMPSALKNPNALTIQLNGSSQGAYDGSSAKTINVTKSSIGLSNVDNVSKAQILASPAITGVPTAPTATAGTNTTQIATTAFVTTAVNNKTSVSGNAGTATKLQTARTINGVSFDGSQNITTPSISTGGNITLHADSDSSTTTEYASIKAGGNELKITSSGGGSSPAKNNNNLTFNGNVVYHAGKKPTPADIGASATGHTHDDRYYTESEINSKINTINNNINGKANSNHNHDDRYYTESEINSKINTINNNISQLSNSNLLINGDFRNPINQRGKTEYTSNEYCVDRWTKWNNTFTTSIQDGFLRNRGTWITLLQYIEGCQKIFKRGTVFTISAKVKCEKNRGVTFSYYDHTANRSIGERCPDIAVGTDWKIIKHTVTVNVDTVNPKTAFCIEASWSDTDTATLDIEWIKLELGSVATPFVPRPYAEELALCQRYYQRLNTKRTPFATFGIALGMGNTSNRLLLSLPVQMRTVPTVSMVGNVRVNNGNIYLSKAKSVSVDQWGGINGKLILNTEQSIPNGLYECSGDNDINADLILDAEIY